MAFYWHDKDGKLHGCDLNDDDGFVGKQGASGDNDEERGYYRFNDDGELIIFYEKEGEKE